MGNAYLAALLLYMPQILVCCLQILGLGTDCDDASPSALLFFDRQRYLFNAGEGFQRFCVEHKVKMNRISSCLLTRLDGQASGGLAGSLSPPPF